MLATVLPTELPPELILKNLRPEPLPSVDRPKINLFQHGTTSKIILKNFSVLF